MTKLFLIFLGSGLGGVLRYTLGGWAHRITNGSFPFGTLLVNVTGCLLIGFLTAALAGRFLIREELRVAVLVGLLGGFTTFSSFGFETFELLNLGQFGLAGMNVFLSIFGGLSGVWIGYRVAESWFGV